jgi:hypothetical protein
VSLNLGLGLHIWDLKPEWHAPYWKVRILKAIPEGFYLLAVLTLKDGLYSRPFISNGMLVDQNFPMFDLLQALSWSDG